MADKRTKLEIVIGAIDKATSVVAGIQRRISAISTLTAPISLIGERLGGLAKAAGLPKLVDGFKGVGSAVTGVLSKVGLIGGAIAGATYGLASIVNEFGDLADAAERLGVSADFIAQVGFAAERSGSSAQQLGDGMKTFVTALGEAKAGKGPLVEFLKVVSPALLKQLKAAKGNEQAFNLLADAMSKLEDPAKRAVLAQKTIGNASLAPLLARGSKGIQELRDRYFELAGSQNKAAASAADVAGGSMKDLKAAITGIKAALVEGLAPALGIVVERLRDFFAENRTRIKEWAADLGKRLPAAIAKLVDIFRGIVNAVRPFVDSSAKLKVAAVALAAVILGPLISSIVSLGIAIAATPVGWILAGIVAIGAAAYLLITRWDAVKGFFVGLWDTLDKKFGIARDIVALVLAPFIYIPAQIIANWSTIEKFFVSLWEGITGAFESAWESIGGIVDKITGAVGTVTGAIGDAIDFINPWSDDGPKWDFGGAFDAAGRAQAAMAAQQSSSSARVAVDFANAPRGTRVTADPRSTASVDLSVGYQMGMP